MSAEQELEAARKLAMDQLTPEERAAMEDELSDGEIASLKAVAGIAGDGGDGDGDGDDEGDDDDAGAAPAASLDDVAADVAAAAAAKAAPAAAPAAEAAAEPAAGLDDEDEPFKPRYSAELPEDFADQVAAVDARETELLQKFKDGEIEAEAFIVEQKAIADQRAGLNKLKDRHETFEAMNEQAALQEWNWNVGRFMRQVKRAEGIDYLEDKEKGADFDGFVKMLAGKPENANKDYEWFLTEAHKRTKLLHGVADKAGDTPKPPKGDGKPASRTPPTKAIPPNLSQVAGGEGPGDVGDDEFSDLDKLDGLEYETALAKMTPAQRERYLAAA